MLYFFMPRRPKFKLKNLELDAKPLGERIAEARKRKGLTQSQLAEKIGISQYLVSDYEIGRLNISATMLVHVAVALGVSADELLGLQSKDHVEKQLSLRLTRRMSEINKLPEYKKKAILTMLDDLIKANS
jgi:transcriptional regulator with XRE-family HTH domain